jgi:uncharacterized protein DUF4838
VAADLRVASRFRCRLEAAALTAIALTATLLSAGAGHCGGAETDRHANRAVLRVCRIGDQPAMVFAGQELERYLRLISGATVVHMPRRGHAPEPDTLWIGCFADFPQLDHPNSLDPRLDDAIVVRVEQRQGIISGANPRAVLIAAYRYLTELGCRWVRPGPDGEHLPIIDDPLARTVNIVESPSYRHRGICFEGASSCEHVLEFIEWAPKVGLNTYFTEYFNGYIFYNNWYSQRHLPEMREKLMPDQRATEFTSRATEEMKRRGLLVHRAGHGWTCLPLGIPADLWDEKSTRDFGELTKLMAEYRGKRQLYRGIPRRTHLCYSNPKVRTMIVEEVAKYAAAHEEVDYLHFWLADGGNHYCECVECRKARPSDFYLMMLNEIDALLTQRNLPTRIVFLIYADLLWPPKAETIKNHDRFVLMFAPLYRTYREPFDAAEIRQPLPPFVLNQLDYYTGQNANFLAAWQKIFPGDSFIFDYRFMWSQYDDPGYMKLAAATSLDIPSLGEIGLGGMISDQPQRVFLPSGLPMMVLARKLWQADLSYDEIAEDYFRAAFGSDGIRCRAYLEQLSENLDLHLLGVAPKGRGPKAPPELVERLRGVPKIVSDFRPIILRNIAAENPCQAKSWVCLGHHADLCTLLSEAVAASMVGDTQQAAERWQAVRALVTQREDEIHSVFDVYLFLNSMQRKFRIR